MRKPAFYICDNKGADQLHYAKTGLVRNPEDRFSHDGALSLGQSLYHSNNNTL